LRSSDALYDEAFGWALEIADFVRSAVVAVRPTERIIWATTCPTWRRRSGATWC
jgi:hypothetical protein